MNSEQEKMKNVVVKIRAGLQKRQEALNKFTARKEAFLIARAQLKKEIEEARELWKATLEKLPEQPFGN